MIESVYPDWTNGGRRRVGDLLGEVSRIVNLPNPEERRVALQAIDETGLRAAVEWHVTEQIRRRVGCLRECLAARDPFAEVRRFPQSFREPLRLAIWARLGMTPERAAGACEACERPFAEVDKYPIKRQAAIRRILGDRLGFHGHGGEE